MEEPFEDINLKEDKSGSLEVSILHIQQNVEKKPSVIKLHTNEGKTDWIETSIPARLDRLPWGGV